MSWASSLLFPSLVVTAIACYSGTFGYSLLEIMTLVLTFSETLITDTAIFIHRTVLAQKKVFSTIDGFGADMAWHQYFCIFIIFMQ